MSHKLLFVCAMNVCRSPLMAFTFAQALKDANEGDTWSVASGGTSVTRREAICSLSATMIAKTAVGISFADAHGSTPLDAAHLADMDMVVVATRSERGKIAKLDPSLRDRTFTLREAVALGAAAPTDTELATLAARMETEDLPLGGYPALLHGRRGLAPVVQPHPTSRWQRRDQTDPFDIPDAHLLGERVHRSTLQQVQTETRTLQAAMGAFLRR